ncbi:MAG: hypothetical protein L0154_06475 [Chloroflexi bacterium]|nr:hypothetical protein [Chloroflexota bacterium]
MQHREAILRYPQATILHEVLWESNTDLHQRIVAAYRAVCDDWCSLPDDGYIHDHLAVHLARSGDQKELHELLVGSPGWLDRKYELGMGFGSYLQDLDVAVWEFEDPLTDDELARLTELHTAQKLVHTLAGARSVNALKALILIGRVYEAISDATLIRDVKKRFEALCAIAQLLDHTPPMLDKALRETADELNTPLQYAQMHVSLGEYREALHWLDGENGSQDSLLEDIARGLIQQSDFWNAHSAIRLIRDSARQIRILVDLLPEFPDVIEEIEASIETILEHQVEAFLAYATALSIIGFEAKSRDYFSRIQSKIWLYRRADSTTAYQFFTEYLILAGFEDWAWSYMERNTDQRQRDRMRTGIVNALCRLNRASEAFAAVDSFEDNTERLYALHWMATRWQEEGVPEPEMLNQLLDRVESLVDEELSQGFQDPRRTIAEIFAGFGHYDLLVAYIESHEQRRGQRDLLETLAYFQAKNNDLKEAEATLNYAQTLHLHILPMTRIQLALVLSEQGQPERAGRILDTIDGHSFHGLEVLFLMPTYVKALAAAGRLEAAAEYVDHNSSRLSVKRALVESLREYGDVERARQLAETLTDEAMKYEELALLVCASSDRELIERILGKLETLSIEIQAKVVDILTESHSVSLDDISPIINRLMMTGNSTVTGNHMHLVRFMLDAGDASRAAGLAMQDGPPGILELIGWYAQRGDLKQVERFVDTIHARDDRVAAATRIGKAGHLDLADKILRGELEDKLNELFGKNRSIPQVARAYADIGMVERSLELMSKLSPGGYDTTRIAIARAQLERGQPDDARETLADVHTSTMNVFRRSNIIGELNELLREHDLYALALEKYHTADINQFIQYLTKTLKLPAEMLARSVQIIAWKAPEWRAVDSILRED